MLLVSHLLHREWLLEFSLRLRELVKALHGNILSV